MNTKRKSKTKKRIITAITVAIAIIVIVALAMRPKETNYNKVEAKTGDITTYYSFSGNIETKNRQTVLSEKVIQISEINVQEGDLVKEGDLLFTTTTDDEIMAKINGEISQINVEENAQVMAGIPLMEIVDYENLQINVKVDEYDISALQTGNDATVYIGAIDEEIMGTIKSISKEGQIVNGISYFTAVIDLDKNANVKVGMSAEVKLLSAEVTQVITLPMSYIQFDDNNQPFVYVMDESEKLVKTVITTGINDGAIVEIINGISSGTAIYDIESATSVGMGFRAASNRGE